MSVSRNGQHTGPVALGGAARVAVVVVAVVALVPPAFGAWNSFAAVEAAVEPSFGDLAWTVPVGVDAGIAVFTALDLIMGLLGMRTRWLRLVPWSLTGVTIYLNVAAETTLIGRVAHGVLPALWVITVEVTAHVLRCWAGLADGSVPVRVDRVRLSRWLLAPGSTLRLWRRMRLREIHSLTEAKDLHLLPGGVDQLTLDLARAALQDRYGPLWWRWKAPRQERVLYRHGALSPAHLHGDGQDRVLPPANGRARPAGDRRARKPAAARGRGNGTQATAPELSADLVELGLRIDAVVTGEGRELTRDELVRRVRAERGSCSNAKGSALLARIQTERGAPSGGRVEVVEVP